MGIDIRERIDAQTDDGRGRVSAYRAFAEDDKPFCISLEYDGEIVAATFQPDVVDDEYTTAEVEASQREQINAWVKMLADLIEKASCWDDFVDDIQAVGDEEVAAVIPLFPYPKPVGTIQDLDSIISSVTSYETKELTYDDTDFIWTDQDGDRYQFWGERWHVQDQLDGEWVEADPRFLTDFGPYTSTDDDRAPRKTKKLGEFQRDTDWTLTGPLGTVRDYKWDSEKSQWSSRENGGEWYHIHAPTPYLLEHSDNYFTQVPGGF